MFFKNQTKSIDVSCPNISMIQIISNVSCNKCEPNTCTYVFCNITFSTQSYRMLICFKVQFAPKICGNMHAVVVVLCVCAVGTGLFRFWNRRSHICGWSQGESQLKHAGYEGTRKLKPRPDSASTFRPTPPEEASELGLPNNVSNTDRVRSRRT